MDLGIEIARLDAAVAGNASSMVNPARIALYVLWIQFIMEFFGHKFTTRESIEFESADGRDKIAAHTEHLAIF